MFRSSCRPSIAGLPPTGIWTIILLIYAFVASVLPVTTLLQPRDFINSHQLIVALALMVLGVIFAAFGGNLHVVSPAVNLAPAKAPSMWPFLFITIACGAISGFHALVSSGTSAKQVRYEEDALFVGYGSMLLEGVLATLVVIAVAAGIGIGYVAKGGENSDRRRGLDPALLLLGRRGRTGLQDQRLRVGFGQHD